MTPTYAGPHRPAAVGVLLLVSVLAARPAWAHEEGRTPYRYVAAPPGVTSEGPPASATSTQPLASTPGGRSATVSASTTDGQFEVSLREGALPPRAGETSVTVQLDQLDPQSLPPLPSGLEAEGNAYRFTLVYARSGQPVPRLAAPGLVSLSAPALPTQVFQLVGRRWEPRASTPLEEDLRVGSIVPVSSPGTFLQAYDPAAPAPAGAPAPPRPSTTGARPVGLVALGVAVTALVAGGLFRRRRAAGRVA